MDLSEKAVLFSLVGAMCLIQILQINKTCELVEYFSFLHRDTTEMTHADYKVSRARERMDIARSRKEKVQEETRK